jgi:hypothetical protein
MINTFFRNRDCQRLVKTNGTRSGLGKAILSHTYVLKGETHVRQSELDLTFAQSLFFLLESLAGKLGLILD